MTSKDARIDGKKKMKKEMKKTNPHGSPLRRLNEKNRSPATEEPPSIAEALRSAKPFTHEPMRVLVHCLALSVWLLSGTALDRRHLVRRRLARVGGGEGRRGDRRRNCRAYQRSSAPATPSAQSSRGR